MNRATQIALTALLLLGFAKVGASAQQFGGDSLRQRLDATDARVRRLPPSRAGRRTPVELNVQVDAMAVIEDWRSREPNSQIGTGGRSGVRINGQRSGTPGGRREVLFACPPGAFLDVAIGEPDADGAMTYAADAHDSCPAGQALVFVGRERLGCEWYRLPATFRGAGEGAPPEIVLSTVPPVGLLGECITTSAAVEPAIAFPEGPAQAPRSRCGGSGVTVNGRATGHSACD